MDNIVAAPSQSQEYTLLRRRNSISTSAVVFPTKLTFLPHHNSSSFSSSSSSTTTTTSSSTTSSSSSSSSFPSDDMELLSIKRNSHSYTSLKDLLPSVVVNSPKPNAVQLAQPGSDICIQNRLVKHAAWAYLQPMSTSPGSADGSFFHRLWPRVASFFDFVHRNVIRALDWTLQIFRIRSSR